MKRVENGDCTRRWRGFGWSWLDEGTCNGAAKVLRGLQDEAADECSGAAPESPRAPPQELPLAARLVLLWLELVAVSGAALLLLQAAWVTGAAASSAWSCVTPGGDDRGRHVVARACEGAAVVFGLFSLTGWLFGRPWWWIARALLAAERVRPSMLFLYVSTHVAILALASLLGQSHSTTTVAVMHDLATWPDHERLLTTLVVAPLTEELFFRGLVLQVTLNRTRNIGAAVGVSSALFALLHLANIRRLGSEHFTVQHLALQSAWALLVGAFLATQVCSSGSLAESALFHAGNNWFAAHAVKSMRLDADATPRTLFIEGCTAAAVENAVASNRVEIVQWLLENRRETATRGLIDIAAAQGHLALVRWLSLHAPSPANECSVTAMNLAAMNGHLAVVEWLHENRREGCTTIAVDGAAVRGHFDVLLFLFANRSDGISQSVFIKVVKVNRFEILRWLAHHFPSMFRARVLLGQLSGREELYLARWLRDCWFAEDPDRAVCVLARRRPRDRSGTWCSGPNA